MEAYLLTLALFITLLLPESIRQPLALAAVMLLLFRLPEQALAKIRQRLDGHRNAGLVRCPCCQQRMKEHSRLCNHCKLEVSLISYRR